MAVLQSQIAETQEQMIERLIRENAQLKAVAKSKITLKVSGKGAVSLYGLGKWPVTLYKTQWERLLENADIIRDFVEANADSLSVKA